MLYKLLKAQRNFLEIPHDYSLDVAVYQGGYGSRKTFAGSLLGILLALKFPGIRGLVGVQTYTFVWDTTLQTYFEHLENFGFAEGKDYDWSSSLQKLTFKNGSEILNLFAQVPEVEEKIDWLECFRFALAQYGIDHANYCLLNDK